jgi:hypothetical protein
MAAQAPFDISRLDKQSYDLSKADGIIKLQVVSRDFMGMVRENSNLITPAMTHAFCILISQEAAWPNVENVNPEFRNAQ